MKIIKNYLPEFVYGSIDGTVTTFAIIAGVAGANLSPSIVLILGFSNVFADGFSMASSNYLSEKSHRAQTGEVEAKPFNNAFATFISFVLVGIIPLMPYVLGAVFGIFKGREFLVSIIATSLAFLLIGAVRGRITKEKRFVASLETLFVGGVAALVSYSVGAMLKGIV